MGFGNFLCSTRLRRFALRRETILSSCRGVPSRSVLPFWPRRAILKPDICREGSASPPCTLPRSRYASPIHQSLRFWSPSSTYGGTPPPLLTQWSPSSTYGGTPPPLLPPLSPSPFRGGLRVGRSSFPRASAPPKHIARRQRRRISLPAKRAISRAAKRHISRAPTARPFSRFLSPTSSPAPYSAWIGGCCAPWSR